MDLDWLIADTWKGIYYSYSELCAGIQNIKIIIIIIIPGIHPVCREIYTFFVLHLEKRIMEIDLLNMYIFILTDYCS